MLTAMESFRLLKLPREASSTQVRIGGSRLGGYTTPPPANDVPDHPFNIIVGRLTDSSGTVRVLFHSDVKAYLSYGDQQGHHSNKTDVQSLRAGEPYDFVIDSLNKNTRYYYRLFYQAAASAAIVTNTLFTRSAPATARSSSPCKPTRI